MLTHARLADGSGLLDLVRYLRWIIPVWVVIAWAPFLMLCGRWSGWHRVHFSVWGALRPCHPPFSVPWSDLTVSRDAWPWFPMAGKPVIRLTLSRLRHLRILVPLAAGERLVEASAGRLRLTGRAESPANR